MHSSDRYIAIPVAVWTFDPLSYLDFSARVEGSLDLGYKLLVLKA
jgi:hypothetical protein